MTLFSVNWQKETSSVVCNLSRLAKSTLTLIPLLGIHEVVFAVLAEERTEGVLRYIILFFQLFFSSFQVRSGRYISFRYRYLHSEEFLSIKAAFHGVHMFGLALRVISPLHRVYLYPSSTVLSTGRYVVYMCV